MTSICSLSSFDHSQSHSSIFFQSFFTSIRLHAGCIGAAHQLCLCHHVSSLSLSHHCLCRRLRACLLVATPSLGCRPSSQGCCRPCGGSGCRNCSTNAGRQLTTFGAKTLSCDLCFVIHHHSKLLKWLSLSFRSCVLSFSTNLAD